MVQMAPEKIVYVSCDPATLARDLKRLEEQGYKTLEAEAVDMFPRCHHVESVALLSRKTPDDVIDIQLDLDELDITSAEAKATYAEIQDYIWNTYGLKVSSLYISQVKRKCGLDVGDSYNHPKSENAHVPQCPPEKERAIIDALTHFGMI
jgi:23S rRNA (uracil1939-C5)-methyltransferase